MYKNRFICVTNRNNCNVNFQDRVREITVLSPYAVILREKDLDSEDYKKLALSCMEICNENNVPFFCNSDIEAARKIGCKNIELSYKAYSDNKGKLADFEKIGVSVHSVKEAESLNSERVSHLIAGHIYATDCKKGLAPRGTDFLRAVSGISRHKVFGIGGINAGNYHTIFEAGAYGFCIMSGLMKCSSPEEYIKKFE